MSTEEMKKQHKADIRREIIMQDIMSKNLYANPVSVGNNALS